MTSKLLTLPQGGYGGFRARRTTTTIRIASSPAIFSTSASAPTTCSTREKTPRLTASIEIDNLTNKVALYNFLSTFSGTHFLQPRTITARVGVVF